MPPANLNVTANRPDLLEEGECRQGERNPRMNFIKERLSQSTVQKVIAKIYAVDFCHRMFSTFRDGSP